MNVVSFHMIVSGHVQGVGYRYFCYQAAQMHHMKGWVRNHFNGTVEILCQGTETHMYNFIATCKKGPPYARIENVIVDTIHTTAYPNFTIHHS